MSLAFVALFVSCNKNNSEFDEDVLRNVINAKWEILDDNSLYVSFEFNKDGNYIVVENDSRTGVKSNLNSGFKGFVLKSHFENTKQHSPQFEPKPSPIRFGNYEINGNIITLSGLGVIKVTNITNENFTFSFTPESTKKRNNFVAGRAEELIISTSNKTDMLCRTWVVDKIAIDVDFLSEEDINVYKVGYGEDWKNELEKIYNSDLEHEVVILFSKTGTYLTSRFYENELLSWKWADKEETKINLYWENEIDDWVGNALPINELNSTTLVLQGYEIIYYLSLKNK